MAFFEMLVGFIIGMFIIFLIVLLWLWLFDRS